MINKFLTIRPITWNILIGTLFSRIAYFMCMPFLAIYLTSIKGIPASVAGIILASSALVGVITSFWGGVLTDQYGARKILISTAVVWALVFFSFTVASSALQFFIINVLNGICYSIFEPATRKVLSDYASEGNKLMVFNFRLTALNLGAIIGPILGIALGKNSSILPFVLLGTMYLLYGFSILLTLKENGTVEKGTQKSEVKLVPALKVIFTDKVFMWTLVGTIFTFTGYSHLTSTLPQYFSEPSIFTKGVETFSILLSVNGFVVILIQYPVVNLMKRFTPFISIALGNVLISLSLVMFSLSHHFVYLIATMVVFTVGELLLGAMIDFLIDELAVESLKGTYFGAISFMRLGNALGPMLGGVGISVLGFGKSTLLFSILAIITLFGVLALLVSRNLYLRENDMKIMEALRKNA
ncbi:MFS family permease [Paenibacillus sp. 1182]|uniref:MDR family MFS transporter n=1 Tax=Paenibacillus sp. 1182 TaxID=2806565 RepID=UPI000F9FCED5|nr:MFS transporter [Paenibacillus sp. 1182]MBP1310365.1 MFS family permease [Paenibacillus sp. 1182]